jgi:RNA polymerase sigma factor (sigma-70 family)
MNLEELAVLAKDGDSDALEELIESIQDRVYGLAIRMLGFPEDARDATQEILIRIVTRLASYRQESAFMTWVYRVAANHLLNTRKRMAEEKANAIRFREVEAWRATDKPEVPSHDEPERALMAEEMRLVCLQFLLLFMERDVRLAFILSEVFEVTSAEGAQVMDISPELYRQRLSRGRRRIRDFLTRQCSLVNEKNICRCEDLVDFGIEQGWLNPRNPRLAGHPCRNQKNECVREMLGELKEAQRVTQLYRSYPEFAAPEAIVDILRRIVASGRFKAMTATSD